MDKADLVWVSFSTLLVLMMATPGLAMFYGGLVRGKNVLSVMIQVLSTFAIGIIIWVLYGYSLAFTEGNAVIGGFSRLLLHGVVNLSTQTFSPSATIPELTFIAFQATFAAITCALIVGAIAERANYAAVLLFTVIWLSLGY
ncbi:MAG: ammonia channel protein, partial [Burkholderiaceae bacterium]